ncbi:hypothetical protein RCL_jg24872.t1 [Rhizophagus clarus]|uniref:Uncharacterized protein n=1 Tax=Rhizophagus clarus TaxID=94130 RepID=A0A8H3LLL1_9GLOM|nr:hypothetical protein RCL_jg24872.t1 [Rhizophagus clarus]
MFRSTIYSLENIFQLSPNKTSDKNIKRNEKANDVFTKIIKNSNEINQHARVLPPVYLQTLFLTPIMLHIKILLLDLLIDFKYKRQVIEEINQCQMGVFF